MARREVRRSFSVRMIPVPGLPATAWRSFLGEWEERAEALGLVAEGTQLLWNLSSAERCLDEVDQVDLLDWLVDRPLVRQAWMSVLCAGGDAFVQMDAGHVVWRAGDPGIGALTLLYRERRLTASMVLQALGGFVRQVSHEGLR